MHVADVDLNPFLVFDMIDAEGGVSRGRSRINLTRAHAIISAVRQSLRRFDTTLAAGKTLTRNGPSKSMVKRREILRSSCARATSASSHTTR